MHTPEDARSLWCPMVRSGSPAGPVNTNAFCMSTECAMWRWHPDAVMNPGMGQLLMPGAGGMHIPAKGYCGLAPIHFPKTLP